MEKKHLRHWALLDTKKILRLGPAHPPPIPSGQLAMDPLPQEIIDEIIDNLPRSSLRSASLVAKRWRARSQQRAFRDIWFMSASKVDCWDTKIQGHSGVSSYVRSVGFSSITDPWDPALFGRVFNFNFSSLTKLTIAGTGCLEGIPEYVSHGGVGGRITTLNLHRMRCSLSVIMSTILAFPNLRDLTVFDITIMSREEPSTRSILSQRRPLESLLIHEYGNGAVAKALAYHQFASRRLTLDAQPPNIQRFLPSLQRLSLSWCS